ncbi:MAG: hypothetical protein AAB851_02655 [Patescibacteria group bacterium]
MLDIKAPRRQKKIERRIKKYKILAFNISEIQSRKIKTWKIIFQAKKARAILGKAANVGAVLALVFLIWAQGGGWQIVQKFLEIFPAYAQTTMYAQNSYKWYANNDAVQPTDAWPAGAANLAENDPITQNAVQNLESKLPGTWLKRTTGPISALAYDSANKTVYILNQYGSHFGKYDTRFDIFTDLTEKISPFMSGSASRQGLSIAFDSTNGAVYIGGYLGKFFKYTPATDTATDLTAKISSFWSTYNLNALTFDSANSVIYLGGGGGGKFAKYTPATDTATDLTA